MERVAAAQPQQRKPAATQRAVYADGFHPVFRAAGDKTAARPEQRADEALVQAQYGDEEAADHASMICQLALPEVLSQDARKVSPKVELLRAPASHDRGGWSRSELRETVR